MALTATQLTRLGSMSGEGHKPDPERLVTDAELQVIADASAKIPDSSGYAPSHASYTATYDLYRAASEAWRFKAGIVAERYDFIAEGGEFTRSQMYSHFMDQAKRYAGMVSSQTTIIDGVEPWQEV